MKCPGPLRQGGAATISGPAPEMGKEHRLNWDQLGQRNSQHHINKKWRNKPRQLKIFYDSVMSERKPGNTVQVLRLEMKQSRGVRTLVFWSETRFSPVKPCLGRNAHGCDCSSQNKTGLKALHKFSSLLAKLNVNCVTVHCSTWTSL